MVVIPHIGTRKDYWRCLRLFDFVATRVSREIPMPAVVEAEEVRLHSYYCIRTSSRGRY